MAEMSQQAVLELLQDTLWPQFVAERRRLDRIRKWYQWEQPSHQLPRSATKEHRALMDLAKTPWLSLVVTEIAQTLFVDGYRTPDQAATDTSDAGWETWLANRMPVHQMAINRAALAYGYSFAMILPGTVDGASRSVIKGMSPRRMQAVYEDPAVDAWPAYAVEAVPVKGKYMVTVYDEMYLYRLEVDGSRGGFGSSFEFIDWQEHSVGVCPVVRFTNLMDLDAWAPGEVEPLIPIAARIDKTDYDRLLVQHFNSWKTRTIAGLVDESASEEQRNRAKLKLRQDDLLVAEDPDTKFGTLDETSMDSFINAKKSDVETLAALAQVPPTALAPGTISNISADAIAELHAGLENKAFERKTSFGVSYNQLLAKAGQIEGRAVDPRTSVSWQDMSVRSISAAADAYGKFVTMLNVPAEALWGRIPGVTQSDVDEWRSMATRAQGSALLQQLIQRGQSAQGGQTPPPAAGGTGTDANRDQQ